MARERSGAFARVLLLALLVALAAWRDALPTPPTALAIALLVALAAATRALIERPSPPRSAFRAPLVAALAFALLAAAALAAGSRGDGSPSWCLLVGLPLAIALAWPAPRFAPAASGAAMAALVSIALGVIAAEPFETAAGRLLVAAIGATLVAGVGFDVVHGASPAGLPPPPRSAVARATRAALLFGLLATLAGNSLELAIEQLPRDWDEPAPSPPREDAIAERLAPRPPPPPRNDAIALVRLLEGDGVAPEAPPALWLRERVLDDVGENDGLVWLAARGGASRQLRDEDDGEADHRIAWPEWSGARPQERLLALQVTLLAAQPTVLPLVTTPAWLEGHLLSLAPDGSVGRPAAPGSSFTFRAAASPSRAEGYGARSAVAADDPERLRLPELFEGRRALQAVVDDVCGGESGDWPRARAFAAILARTGRLDESAPFRHWSEFLGARAGGSLHFAQACALLCRMAKIPARVASGWRTSRFSATDRTFEVRASDARYWTEVRLEGTGWIELEPTPEPEELPAPPKSEETPSDVAEAANPATLKESVAQQRPLVAGFLVAAAILAILLLPGARKRVKKLLSRRGPQGGAALRRAWRYWQELIELCRRAGIVAAPGATASEFAAVVVVAAPAESARLQRLLGVYHACRFGDAPLSAEDEASARALLAALPAQLSARPAR